MNIELELWQLIEGIPHKRWFHAVGPLGVKEYDSRCLRCRTVRIIEQIRDEAKTQRCVSQGFNPYPSD